MGMSQIRPTRPAGTQTSCQRWHRSERTSPRSMRPVFQPQRSWRSWTPKGLAQFGRIRKVRRAQGSLSTRTRSWWTTTFWVSRSWSSSWASSVRLGIRSSREWRSSRSPSRCQRMKNGLGTTCRMSLTPRVMQCTTSCMAITASKTRSSSLKATTTTRTGVKTIKLRARRKTLNLKP